MKCDELKPLMCAHEPNVRPMYDKSEVDEAIAELKARIADLEKLNHDLCERVTENDDIRLHWEEIEQTRAENEQLKKETEFMHSNCKWYAGDGCARLLGEKLAIIDENVKLKQKLENVQASMYADVVDANMEVRRLKRALWRMGAMLGRMGSLAYHNIKAKLYFLDDAEGVKWALRKREQWEKVETKCRAKAEEYK